MLTGLNKWGNAREGLSTLPCDEQGQASRCFFVGCRESPRHTGRASLFSIDPKPMNNEIYLAGGCFWGTEHYLKQIRGVLDTTTGYANSCVENPSYEQVCSGSTRAAEAVKVVFDTHVLSLEKLLEIFYLSIDPTSLNRQGYDCGTQYRTGIYFTAAEDEATVVRSLAQLQSRYKQPIVVEAQALSNFYPAESYHQDYLEVNPRGYCHIRPGLFEYARKANTAIDTGR